MALDLSSPEAIVRSTSRVVARQRPAVGASVNTSSDPAWGSLMRVDPGTLDGFGRPEYSYLIYKVLGDGPIVGERMPPTGGSLAIDEISTLADWIAAGAPNN
jgi:hypothetical protein